MFNRKFKLMSQAIGLVAVLVMVMLLLALPGVTQQNPISRPGIVDSIKGMTGAILTAAEGVVFNVKRVVVYSDDEATVAYIPLDTTSRCWELNCWASGLLGEKIGEAVLGLFVVSDFLPDIKFPLPKGTYIVKAVSRDKAVFVNQEGDEIASAPLKVTRLEQKLTQPIVEITTKHSSPWSFETSIKCCGAGVRGHQTKKGRGVRLLVKVA